MNELIKLKTFKNPKSVEFFPLRREYSGPIYEPAFKPLVLRKQQPLSSTLT